MSEDLSALRRDIDAIDDQLLQLLSRRAANALAIGRLKSGATYRPEREAQVLRRLMDANPGPLPPEAIGKLFREVMSACLALEHSTSVAYLGPAGTFSEAAALKQFGQSAVAVPFPTIDEVFRAVEAGNADYAVVPVENSAEGAIGRTLDLMTHSPAKVVGEVVLRIHHQLLTRCETLGAIRRLYSHAQSLGQCQRWLNQNLAAAERIPVASNAEAARLASGEPNTAAIAGETAAQRYGLGILAANIEDEPNNTTRFLVLGMHDVGPSGRDKTSIVLTAKNRPGAMHELLAPLAHHQVSMTKLESRPSRTGMWEYLFFVDLEGHRTDANVDAALAELRDRALFIKILGSYPVAVLP